MTQGAEQESAHSEELALLERVLMPLGEERCNEILAMVDKYLANVSPILGAAGYLEPSDPVRNTPGETAEQVQWIVGEPSPLDATRTVFAIFDWPEMGQCLVAYSFSAVVADGEENATAFYFREKIYRPRYSWGPLTLGALYNDLTYHLDVDTGDDPPAGKNGSH